MKNLYLAIIFLLSISTIKAQTTSLEKKALPANTYIVSVDSAQKTEIDWSNVKAFFNNTKHSDSIQISVELKNMKVNNLKSETKYSVKGLRQHLDELVEKLKSLINNI